MAVDIESLSMPDFLTLLRYEGNPPPGPEFDAIRMTPQEWTALFPGAAQHAEPTEEPIETGATDAGHPQSTTASV